MLDDFFMRAIVAGVGIAFVTGPLGDGAAALALIRGQLALDKQQADYLYRRFYQPEPQLAAAKQLLGISRTAIDISDGLLADLAHIASASQVAMVVDIDRLPLSPVLHGIYQQQPRSQRNLLRA